MGGGAGSQYWQWCDVKSKAVGGTTMCLVGRGYGLYAMGRRSVVG